MKFRTASKQLQAKFKHAEDFGVFENYSPSSATKFEAALKEHKFDPLTNRNVIMDTDGNFVSGWKLNPDQIKALTTTGKLGGK